MAIPERQSTNGTRNRALLTGFQSSSNQGQSQISALQMAKTPRSAQRYAILLVLMIIMMVPVMLFAPWVQTVHGRGRAIAFNPTQRPMFVVSPIEGRVFHWYVVENDKVKQGQLLAELKDNDPKIIERLETQMLLTEQRKVLSQSIIVDQQLRVKNVEAEVNFQISSMDANIAAQEALISREEATVSARKADELRQEFNLRRINKLNKDALGQIASKDAVEEAERTFEVAKETRNAAERSKIAAEKQLKAMKESRKSLVERKAALKNQEEIALNTQENNLRVIEREYQQIQTAVDRQKALFIYAPADGTIFKILANADSGGQLVRPGERLAELVPDIKPGQALADPRSLRYAALSGGYGMTFFPGLTADQYPGIVTELSIDGNDLPLVEKGDRVLIQFEGWPAVQVAGVPNAAQGTFEGKVYFVDTTSDANGRFRVVVEPLNKGTEPVMMPDPDGREGIMRAVMPWPQIELLRQGVRAQGWVLIRQVSVGFEIWRQLNGFPPARELKSKQGGSSLGPVGK